MSPNSTVVEAINSPAELGVHYILKDLLKHFLPTQNDRESLQWLLQIANNPSVVKKTHCSPTARCLRQCFLLILTGGKYDQSCREQKLLDMLLDRKVHAIIQCACHNSLIFFRVLNCKLLEVS